MCPCRMMQRHVNKCSLGRQSGQHRKAVVAFIRHLHDVMMLEPLVSKVFCKKNSPGVKLAL